jgi:drug/metabolite transporter (DMT)-like permease
MTPISLLLILLAAMMHAGWNLLLKQESKKYLASWWASLASLICVWPVLFFYPFPKPNIWPYALVSGALEAVYMITLASAYYRGDYSLVYPISRGAAPAFLVIWAVLFLHETPSTLGLAGIIMIIVGLILVGSSAFLLHRETIHITTRNSVKGVLLALLVALFISFYSVIDGAAVKQVSPVSYIVLVFGVMTLCISPYVIKHYGWEAMVAEWRTHWLRLTALGVLSILAYMLVLVVYSLSPVSYAGTIREVSVVIAAVIGAKYLGEGFGVKRVIGSTIIFCGILLIAIGG